MPNHRLVETSTGLVLMDRAWTGISKNRVALIDDDGGRIPQSGKVVKWKFYARKNERNVSVPVGFQIWRSKGDKQDRK